MGAGGDCEGAVSMSGADEMEMVVREMNRRAREHKREAMEISYGEGCRLFSYYGDEGSGRKFFIKQFCRKNDMRAISMNCKKLFVYDFSFVEKALWAVTRECILLNACCVLEELSYREEEKEKLIAG